jgi:hypothetical protein
MIRVGGRSYRHLMARRHATRPISAARTGTRNPSLSILRRWKDSSSFATLFHGRMCSSSLKSRHACAVRTDYAVSDIKSDLICSRLQVSTGRPRRQPAMIFSYKAWAG